MDMLLADKISLVRGDITKVQVDAVVNAANTTLLGGGGVDGRIHYVAGPELLEECSQLRGCATGAAKITKGYKLLAKYVIHAVGPVYRGGKSREPELLASCYNTALRLAVENSCESIAFPAISCGAYGYPLTEAAAIALTTVTNFLRKDDRLRRVVFVLYDEPAYKVYQQLSQSILQDKTRTNP